jgi:NAD(P)-dependent dehydrogenase (short-subunit alcohol dehydrogenase family)
MRTGGRDLGAEIARMSKVWFITGCSRGFGRIWAEAALARGDKVAASARDAASLAGLVDSYGQNVLPLRLDVADKSACELAINRAHETFGRLDVVVNNAGYGLFGTLEEASEQEIRDQFETNVFGAMWVTKAALPLLRTQRSGHFIQISSIAGIFASSNLGLYHASKWALEAFSQSLAAEVRDFGIKVTIIEPGGYSTEWGTTSAKWAKPLKEYDPIREAHQARRAAMRRGDPRATAPVLLEIVDMPEPPLRAIFGTGIVENVKKELESRIALWEKYRQLSDEAALTSIVRTAS